MLIKTFDKLEAELLRKYDLGGEVLSLLLELRQEIVLAEHRLSRQKFLKKAGEELNDYPPV